MSGFYEMLTPGDIPIDLTEMKLYLKVTSDSDDLLISDLIVLATEYGEDYTGRDFRENSWRLLLDEFETRIPLCRDPVASITTVSHLVDDVFTTVTGSTYYLKKGTTSSEILLQDGQGWPTDTDTIEHGIQVDFQTTALRKIDIAKIAIKRLVMLMYQNRNDCPDISDLQGIENVNNLLNTLRIPRI
jgi:uncharacterized phiE125 gp8 family phage protein